MSSINVFVFITIAISFALSSENAVICYYGSWATYRQGNGKFDVDNINPKLCTHLIYAFAGINNQGEIISLDPYLDLPDNWGRDNYGKFNALKRKNPSLKTILAVGGYSQGSAKFSRMAANTILKKNFINSAVKLLITYGFDGLGLDWEYPNRLDSVHGKDDIDNFTKLLKDLSEAFDRHGLTLSAAVSSIKEMASLSYDIPAISMYLDTIHLMTYDLAGPWDAKTGHNSPLHAGEGYDDISKPENLFTVDQALRYWISAGCPPEKIALGIPFFAHTFKLVNSGINGVRALSSGAGIGGPYTGTAGTLGYNELCYMLQMEPWTKRYDILAKVPYAYKDVTWATYDDAQSITIKIKYAKTLGINKIMIWNIDSDDFRGDCGNGVNPLLKAVNAASNDNITHADLATEEYVITTTDFTSKSELRPMDICKQEGFASNPKNCASFYRCIRDAKGTLQPFEFQCPEGLYWDQKNLHCNYKYLVQCNV